MPESGERARRAEAIAIVASSVEADTRCADTARDKSALGRANHPHGDVGVATPEVLVAIGDGKLDRDARVLRTEVCEDRREHLASDDFARRHPNRAFVERRFG